MPITPLCRAGQESRIPPRLQGRVAGAVQELLEKVTGIFGAINHGEGERFAFGLYKTQGWIRESILRSNISLLTCFISFL